MPWTPIWQGVTIIGVKLTFGIQDIIRTSLTKLYTWIDCGCVFLPQQLNVCVGVLVLLWDSSSFLCCCCVLIVFQTDRRFMKFYIPKLLIVGLIWISAVTLSSWQEYNEIQDPTYYYRLDTTNFMVCYYHIN